MEIALKHFKDTLCAKHCKKLAISHFIFSKYLGDETWILKMEGGG